MKRAFTSLAIALMATAMVPALEPIYSEDFDGISSDGCSVAGTFSAPFDAVPLVVRWGTFSVGYGANGCAASSLGFEKVPGIDGESAIRYDDLQRANSGSTEVNIVRQVFNNNEFWWTMALKVEDGGGVPDDDFLVLPMLFTPFQFRQLFDARFVADSVNGDRLVIGGSSITTDNNGIPETSLPLELWNGTAPWAAEDKFHLIAFRFSFHQSDQGWMQVYIDPASDSAAPVVDLSGFDNVRLGIADAIGYGRHWQAASPVANGNAILTASRVAYWDSAATLADVRAHYSSILPPSSTPDWDEY